MVSLRQLINSLVVLVVPAAAIAQSLAQVPDSIRGDLREELRSNRAKVEARIDDFNKRATAFNARCEGLPASHPNAAACRQELQSLSDEAVLVQNMKATFNASVAAATAVNTNAMVVDTRGLEVAGSELVAQVPQLRGSPGATAMAKGFQALINKDWQLTLAWWQTAQLRDPLNPAIARGVELASWTIEYHKQQGRPSTLSGKRAAGVVPPPAAWYRNQTTSTTKHMVDEAIRFIEAAIERAEAWLTRRPEGR